MYEDRGLTDTAVRTRTIAWRERSIEQVIGFMRDRFNEPLSLHDMAEVAGFSHFHFNRMFHQSVGSPPGRFLCTLRLQAAKRLLLTTQLSVTDICFEVGYNSLGTFTTRFAQLVGLSPSRFRLAKEDTSLLTYLESLRDSDSDLPRVVTTSLGVSGRINAPDDFRGPIFVGLFQTPIPQSQPVVCVLVNSPGTYCMPPVPDGYYYVFAVGFAPSSESLAYLLPDTALRGGLNHGPLQVSADRVIGNADVTLRPAQLTDPPILVSLPSLLLNRLMAN